MRHGCIMSPWIFSVYNGCIDKGGKNGDGSEISIGGARLEIA